MIKLSHQLVAAFCVMLLSGIPESAFAHVSRSEFLVAGGHVGKIRIGEPLEELRRLISEKRIKTREHIVEGIFFREWTVYSTRARKGRPIMVIQMKGNPEWFVHSVEVFDPHYITERGVGPGSTLAMVKKTYPLEPVVWSDESTYGIALRGSKVTLRLNVQEPAPTVQGFPPAKDLTAVPDATRIKSIFVY